MVSAAGLPEKVSGVVLLNSAGQFGDANVKPRESEETGLQKVILKPLKEIFQRVILGFLFWQAKQPARVESVLRSVRVLSWLYECCTSLLFIYIILKPGGFA